ncbi:LTA synthase family protein [Chitinibacter sp. SCUT-21]|uniref:LTA synthase family protein n=1 Tax=Chitinibacter sp. SCUT-21 TaxID=2970891 RepID=UPI0035A5BF38
MFDLAYLILLSVFVGLIASFILEPILLQGASPAWRRPWKANLLHVCGWLLIFCFELILFQRPWFASLLACAIFLLLIVISNTKQAMLREPFIYQDFEYFADLIKHPRLYIPFFGISKTLLGILIFSTLISAGILIEPSLLNNFSFIQFSYLIIFITSTVFSCLFFISRNDMEITLNPAVDVSKLGLFASLISYRWAENRDLPSGTSYTTIHSTPLSTSPHLLVIQSESFFDIRRLVPQIKPEILNAFDALCTEACFSGRLKVPAWGANTVRTEFAFLSGRSPESLGVHQFNPYRRFAAKNQDSIALRMRTQGYKTVCIHPYPATFYRRNIIYPLLGFDEFIDVSAFDAPQGMPYVSDLAVAKKIDELLATANEPLFIFVITMENHGPLHLERVNVTDAEKLYMNRMPSFCDELTIYLRHLRNANQMLIELKTTLARLARPTVMCWYGDHVPIIPALYQQVGEPDGTTEYFIWTNHQTRNNQTTDLKVEELAEVIDLIMFDHLKS